MIPKTLLQILPTMQDIQHPIDSVTKASIPTVCNIKQVQGSMK